jgi:hypothetical protein
MVPLAELLSITMKGRETAVSGEPIGEKSAGSVAQLGSGPERDVWR